jgi:hypothetical protein
MCALRSCPRCESDRRRLSMVYSNSETTSKGSRAFWNQIERQFSSGPSFSSSWNRKRALGSSSGFVSEPVTCRKTRTASSRVKRDLLQKKKPCYRRQKRLIPERVEKRPVTYRQKNKKTRYHIQIRRKKAHTWRKTPTASSFCPSSSATERDNCWFFSFSASEPNSARAAL